MDDAAFTYDFRFSVGRRKRFTVTIGSGTVTVRAPAKPKPPPWTALDYHQCANCPLRKEEEPRCPVAEVLARVSVAFDGCRSSEKTEVRVESAERTYRKKLSLQQGLQGLFGLLMATSRCPHMAFLRPMARFHLPFSSMDESLIRSLGFYLLSQYFVASRGGDGDFELARLRSLFESLHVVNAGLVKRFRSVARGDAGVNSIILLDTIAQTMPLEIGNRLDEIEKYFRDGV